MAERKGGREGEGWRESTRGMVGVSGPWRKMSQAHTVTGGVGLRERGRMRMQARPPLTTPSPATARALPPPPNAIGAWSASRTQCRGRVVL